MAADMRAVIGHQAPFRTGEGDRRCLAKKLFNKHASRCEVIFSCFLAVLRVNFPELDFTSSITLFYLILEKRKNYSGIYFCNQTPKGAKYGEDRVLCSE